MTTQQKKRVPQVLIVDDEPEIRIVLKEVIGLLGYSILEASKATEALEQIEKHHIDLILLDILLQGASGLDILKVMRRRHLQIPIIIISGYVTQDLASEAANLGVKHIVAKPFTPTRIAQEIRKIIPQSPIAT